MRKIVANGVVTIVLENGNIIKSQYECSFEYAINFVKDARDLFESYGIKVASVSVDAPRTVEEIPAH